MDVQKRAELGIGYYYRTRDDKEIYIPIERGNVIEKWLDKNDNVVSWVKMEEINETEI